jgi:hypothetical protein
VEEIENVMVLKIQKRVLGSINGLNKTESCRPVFKVLKILSATALYVFEVLCYIKKQHFLKNEFKCRNTISEENGIYMFYVVIYRSLTGVS